MKTKQFLNLSFELTKAEFKLQNEGSYFGLLWYLFNPLLMFLLLLIIFSTNLGSNIPNYSLYLFLGIILFNLFQQVTIESTKVLRKYKGFIKSTAFPIETLIVSAILKTVFSHLFEIIIFIIYAAIINHNVIYIIFYPIILAIFCLFIYGISLILSAISVFYIDVENIWIHFSRILWFVSPIFYLIENQKILMIINIFNPVYYFITVTREIVIYHTIPSLGIIFGLLFFTLLSVIIGTIIFYKLRHKFVEIIR